MSKLGQLSAIHTDIFHCHACPLHEKRLHTVPGAGNPDTEILFIGEAPGEQEDKQGLPFVGRSGKYLDELLAGIGLHRDTIFIANVVKCRPPDNRDPHPEEISACNPYLTAQIEIINPLVIVTLGRYSMQMFFPNERISQIHGQARYGTQRAYYPLYHPAAVLRSSDLVPLMEADFKRLPNVVAEMKRRKAQSVDPDPEPDVPLDSSPKPTPKQKTMFD